MLSSRAANLHPWWTAEGTGRGHWEGKGLKRCGRGHGEGEGQGCWCRWEKGPSCWEGLVDSREEVGWGGGQAGGYRAQTSRGGEFDFGLSWRDCQPQGSPWCFRGEGVQLGLRRCWKFCGAYCFSSPASWVVGSATSDGSGWGFPSKESQADPLLNSHPPYPKLGRRWWWRGDPQHKGAGSCHWHLCGNGWPWDYQQPSCCCGWTRPDTLCRTTNWKGARSSCRKRCPAPIYWSFCLVYYYFLFMFLFFIFYFFIFYILYFLMFGLPNVTGLWWPNNGFNSYFPKYYFPMIIGLWWQDNGLMLLALICFNCFVTRIWKPSIFMNSCFIIARLFFLSYLVVVIIIYFSFFIPID